MASTASSSNPLPSEDEVYSLETLDRIPPSDQSFAVLGDPISHSISPKFQRAAFSALGIPAHYHRIRVPAEQLSAVVEVLKQKKFRGWNCTLPLKTEMLKLVDKTTPSALEIGAINTILFEDGKLLGFNTDAEGWVAAIRDDFQADVRDLRIMLLGVGGAGRAIATQAALEKCERLILVNRTLSTAQALAAQLAPHFETDRLRGPSARLAAIPWDENVIAQELDQVDLVVNATSVGLKPYDPPILPSQLLQPHLLVYDTIYNPSRTKLLQGAEQVGARVANGASMLLYQGAAAFTIWTGKPAPIEPMRKALFAALS